MNGHLFVKSRIGISVVFLVSLETLFVVVIKGHTGQIQRLLDEGIMDLLGRVM
jgi:hypothetical protein